MSVYYILTYMAIAYYVVFYSIHLLHLVLGYKDALRWKKLGIIEETHRLSRSEIVPPVSLVVKLDFMGDDAIQWVDNVLSQRFPEMEVLVISGGAVFNERVESLIKAYFLRRVDRVYRRELEAPDAREIFQSDDYRLSLILTDALEWGASLNLAVNLARYPLVAVVGKDVNLEEDALLRMVRPIMEGERSAPAVMGVELPLKMVGGNLLPKRRITRFALMESLRIQLGYQAGAPYLGGPMTTYSPLLLFRKRDLVKAGGFDPDLAYMGTEMDMILRLHRMMREDKMRYRFVFLPQLVCRRLFPERWRDHFREYGTRYKGISTALWAERDMLFKARYGRLGMFDLPAFWLFIHLAGVMGFIAYALSILFFVLGKIGLTIFLVFLATSLIYPAVVGVGAVIAARRELGILGGHGALLYGYAFATQLWFRQLTALSVFFYTRAVKREEK